MTDDKLTDEEMQALRQSWTLAMGVLSYALSVGVIREEQGSLYIDAVKAFELPKNIPFAWDRLLAHVAALSAEKGWQPIETAPMDGTYMLLVSPAHGRVIGAHVTGDVWHLIGVGTVTSASERPTHWIRLLDAPPATAKQSERV